MGGLQIRPGFRDKKSVQEGLQIRAAVGISKWGEIDYKSTQERFQIGAGITNQGRDYRSVQNIGTSSQQFFQ